MANGICMGCDNNTLDDCIACVKTGTCCPCNIWNVVKDILEYYPKTYIKTADPTVNDDVDLNYKQGDIWINTNNSKVYICLDASDGAADWDQIN